MRTRPLLLLGVALSSLLALALLGMAAPAAGGAAEAGHPQLEVGIRTSVTSGTAPLPVQLLAVISGGSGNYTAISWTLGPNAFATGPEVNYTFPSPCECLVQVSVADSAGGHASATVVILIGAPPTSTPARPGAIWPMGILAVGSCTGLGVGLVAWTVARPELARRNPYGSSSDRRGTPEVPSAHPAAMSPPPTEVDAIGASAALRLSERVILHLAREPSVGPYDVAGTGRTQSGIARRFGASQSAVSNVLARLAAAEVIVVLTRHVTGEKRRRKVYLLTPYGEELAKGLAARRSVPVRPPPSGLLPPPAAPPPPGER